MIWLDMQSEENQKQSENLFRRWHKGELASQPGIATVVLGMVLSFTLFAAQLVVHARSGFTQAVQNGADLIQKISENGLSHYLPQETTIRYSIIEKQGEPTNFAVTIIEPYLQSKPKYKIDEMRFTREGRPCGHEQLIIDDQLTSYRYGNESYKYIKNSRGYYQGKYPIRILDESAQNMIPRPLLDFFSSVAAAEKFEEGVVLDIPDQQVIIHGFGYAFSTITLRVQPGGEIPADIQQTTPNGYSVRAEPIESRIPSDATGSEMDIVRQDIYYDSQHQLVWQKDTPSGDIIRSVSRQELIEAIPAASVIIQNEWLNINPKTDELTDDEKEI